MIPRGFMWGGAVAFAPLRFAGYSYVAKTENRKFIELAREKYAILKATNNSTGIEYPEKCACARVSLRTVAVK